MDVSDCVCVSCWQGYYLHMPGRPRHPPIHVITLPPASEPHSLLNKTAKYSDKKYEMPMLPQHEETPFGCVS